MNPGARILAESTNPYCGGAPAIDRAYYRMNKPMGACLDSYAYDPDTEVMSERGELAFRFAQGDADSLERNRMAPDQGHWRSAKRFIRRVLEKD